MAAPAFGEATVVLASGPMHSAKRLLCGAVRSSVLPPRSLQRWDLDAEPEELRAHAPPFSMLTVRTRIPSFPFLFSFSTSSRAGLGMCVHIGHSSADVLVDAFIVDGFELRRCDAMLRPHPLHRCCALLRAGVRPPPGGFPVGVS